MFAFIICIWTLQEVHSACNVQDICPDNTKVQTEIVDRHNAFRRAVQPTASDMLRMDYGAEIAVSAQAWVDRCILSHGAPSNRMFNGYEMGENLFYASVPMSWTDVIGTWHSEMSFYLYPDGSLSGRTVGHYTQVVWNSSYKVGCGMKLCNNNTYLYGCHYYRAGNFGKWPPYKAGPPCASCPDACQDNLCNNPCPYINKYFNCPTLKKIFGCRNKLVSAWCPASCECTNRIIPVA